MLCGLVRADRTCSDTREVCASRLSPTFVLADLILVGHTHLAGERRIAGSHVVNPGPVSLPCIPDDRARWALIEATTDNVTIEFQTVRYDLRRVVANLDHQRHPSSRWLATKMTHQAETR
jgi:predicted phosphodiesterase